MNILFIFHSIIDPSNGGVERVTSLLGGELKKRGHAVTYLSTCSDNITDSAEGTIPQLFLNFGNESNNIILDKYHSLLRQNGINVIINQQYTPESELLLNNTPQSVKKITCYHIQPFPYLGKERDIKLNTFPHDILRRVFKWFTIVFPYGFRLRSKNAERKRLLAAADSSDTVVFLSERFRGRVLDNCPGFPAEKFYAINNPNTFKCVSPEGAENKENIVLFVGRIQAPQKLIKGFIEMWHKFYQTNPDWRAYIIGEGPDRKMYERMAMKMGVKSLSFEGQQKNVLEYFKRADFICLPSLYEGWGMVLTEGMANRCIPVCFDSYESACDIIEDGVDGIIARSFDINDMAMRMNNVAKNRELRKRMSERAQKKIERFDISKIADEWENLISEI